MTLPKDLILVRHGQSVGNAAKRLFEQKKPEALMQLAREQHTSNYQLTPMGEAQAAAAGAWLRTAFPEGFTRHYVSEYLRAKQTAGLLNLPNARWYKNVYLCERDSGSVETRAEAERDEEFKQMLRMREHAPFFWRPGAGETLAELAHRLDKVLDTLHRLADPNGRVIIVCHGEVMWTFRVLLERLSQEAFREAYLSEEPALRIHNCQIMHYSRQDPERPGAEPKPYLSWVRDIRPTEDPVQISDWRAIKRQTYTNEDLLAEVERYRARLK